MQKTFKRSILILGAAIIATAAICLCGCTTPSTYDSSLKEATIKSPNIISNGKLKVGVEGENSPMSGRQNNQYVGIDVDIAAAIADELGLELEVTSVGINAESALTNKKVDMVMGAYSSTSTDNCWKSDVYLKSGPVLFSTKANAAVPTKADNKKFVTALDSSAATAVQNQYSSTNIKTVSEVQDCFEMLANNQADFVAADAVVGTYAALLNGTDAYINALLATPSGYCAEVASDKTELQTKVNAAIQKLINNGTIDVIQRKWLARTIQLDNVAMTEGASNEASQSDLDSAVYGEIAGTSKTN